MQSINRIIFIGKFNSLIFISKNNIKYETPEELPVFLH